MTSKAPAVRHEDICSVADLRAVLATLADDVACGPYFAEYSPSDHQLDIYPTVEDDD